MKMDNNGMKNLICGIVKKAVDDWRESRKKLKKNPDSISANYMLKGCEIFFRSDYFENLTWMNGRELLKRLMEQEEAEG